MTGKQAKFCDEYILSNGNAAAAARAAGYSSNGAKVTGARLLTLPKIRRSIDERLESLQSEKIAAQTEILEFLSAVMRGEVEETLLPPGGKQIIVPARCSDRLRAAEMLLKIYGAYNQPREEENNFCAEYVETLERIWTDD